MAAWLSESKRLIYLPYHFNKLIESVKSGEYNLVITPIILRELGDRIT